jgi:predicted 3-demethylubiquinone-9 3-methyltransferase (glyoxalase superfamily)/uncharacterized protein YndB with AHSA1/START domain
VQGRPTLRFERLLDHPPDRVWLALTQLDQLRRWHPSPFELERRVGGTVSFLPPEGNAFGDGDVTAYEPSRLLAYSWGEDHLRWELEPRDGGTRLVLTHTFDDRLKAARDAAGWDLCLDALATSIAHVEDPLSPGESAIPAGWSRVALSDAVVPLLMFAGNAEDAMRFYVSVFFPARIEQIERYGVGEPGEGMVRQATLRLGDSTIQCIDSPIEHAFGFTPAVSLAVRAQSADAVGAMFARLSKDGIVLMPLESYPFSERFGWVTDRFGVSWQLTLA